MEYDSHPGQTETDVIAQPLTYERLVAAKIEELEAKRFDLTKPRGRDVIYDRDAVLDATKDLAFGDPHLVRDVADMTAIIVSRPHLLFTELEDSGAWGEFTTPFEYLKTILMYEVEESLHEYVIDKWGIEL